MQHNSYGMQQLIHQALTAKGKCKDMSKDSKDGKDCKDDICPIPLTQIMQGRNAEDGSDTSCFC